MEPSDGGAMSDDVRHGSCIDRAPQKINEVSGADGVREAASSFEVRGPAQGAAA
jgi:hypothetical protein